MRSMKRVRTPDPETRYQKRTRPSEVEEEEETEDRMVAGHNQIEVEEEETIQKD